MREDGCSCVLAPKELQLAGYSLCLRPTTPSRSYGNHYYYTTRETVLSLPIH